MYTYIHVYVSACLCIYCTIHTWTELVLCLFLIGFTTDGDPVCRWSSVIVLWAFIGNVRSVEYHVVM